MNTNQPQPKTPAIDSFSQKPHSERTPNEVYQPSTSQEKVNAEEEGMDVQNGNTENFMPPTATHPYARRRTRSRYQSQQHIIIERLQAIEERRIEADMLSAQGLADIAAALNRIADAFIRIANAISEQGQLIANALLDAARRLPQSAE